MSKRFGKLLRRFWGCFLLIRSVSVAYLAKHLGVSVQRVRVMLAQGRIVGRKAACGRWEIDFPPTIQFGSRGPKLGQARNYTRAIDATAVRFSGGK